MMSGKKRVLFRSEEKKDRQSVADFLHEFADKIAEGEIVLLRGTDETRIAIPEIVEFEIKATKKTKKGNRVKRDLEIELDWYEGEQEKPVKLG
jgi:amphi-Trp domain-containing protein